MSRPSNFTDRQKAELFARDRATCAYTGRNLWLLGHGCDPHYQVDWADHLLPVSNGGLSTLKNGACASWAANFKKSDKTNAGNCLFLNGAPTAIYLRQGNTLTAALKRQLGRFSTLHYSDWYFNRALFRLWLGVAFLAENGCTRSRDDTYYAKASFSILEKWRKIAAKEKAPSLERRGLLPKRTSQEHRLMLAMRDATSVSDIRGIMGRLVPLYVARLDEPKRRRG